MNYATKTLTLLLVISINLGAQTTKENISLADIWANGKYYPAFLDDMVPMNNDDYYAILENSFQINTYAFKTGEKDKTIVNFYDVFKEAGVKAKAIDTYVFSKDENKILVATDKEAIYRHSKVYKYYVYDLKKKTLTALSDDKKQRLATFSPDGSKIAYVIENNLFIKDLGTGTTTQITDDGKINEIINGATDWVYEEEFSFSQAYSWSPDGQRIAFYRFDETHVKEFSMTMYGELYPEQYKYKYPKAGEDNAKVDIYVYNVNNGKTTKMDTGAEADQYIPRIKWSKDPLKLAVYRMNRLQNHLEILLADAENGTTNRIYEEKNKCYIEINDNLVFTDDGKYFIITNETNGYNHLYRYGIDGKLFNQITTGDWEVIEILGFDAAENKIYFSSTQDSPMNKHICSIGITGENLTRLSSGSGHHIPVFSKNYKYYIDDFSNLNTPSVYTVYETKNGKALRVAEDNKALNDILKNTNMAPAEFFTCTTGDSVSLNGWMIKPPDFDPTKKYPVLLYVYGGPGQQTVENSWGSLYYIWYQHLAEKGYIVVSVDNRGTMGRGEAFRKATYGQLGKLETNDQIDVAKYLISLPYIDKDRIGMFGWSFGGYLTLLCLTKGNDYFKTGVAVAPVTNWRFYDSIYTERYMGLPKDNAKGYDDNSPINHVKKLKGNLLMVHGSADDNVHLQNTMEMSNALVNANKKFDMHIYTNKNHGIYGGYTRLHLFEKITAYIESNL